MRWRTTSLARGRLTELCRAGLDSITFRRELRTRLAALLDFDAACINTVDPESLLITSSIGDGLSTPHARLLFQLEDAGRDFNLLRELSRPVTMNAATQGEVARSRRMRDIILPLGLRDELRAPLRVGGLCWGYLHLFRRSPFTATDLALITELERELAVALRASAALITPSDKRRPGVLVLDEDGETIGEGAEAFAWLRSLGEDVGGTMPHLVHVTHLRALRGPARARVRTSLGWMSVHASALGRGTAIIFDAAHEGDVAPLLFHAHGLTRREHEVALLLAAGHSNESIAAQLELRLHTVKDHVKSVFGRTRVSGRLEFVTRFA